jgi:hypothetical protein
MKNFILILSTLILVVLLVFFYQRSFDKGVDLVEKADEVKTNLNIQMEDLNYTISQINDAFGSLKETSKLSKLLKSNKQEIQFVDKEGYLVYSNSELKFDINLDKNIFSDSKDKTFFVVDDSDLVLVFTGAYNQSDVNLSLLVDKTKKDCDFAGLEKILVNENIYYCGLVENEEKDVHIMSCKILRFNTCLNFEYTITNVIDNIIGDNLKVENLILKNIVFNK